MPSPMALLEQRELNARQRLHECREQAERIEAALAEAERACERAVIAREEFAAALEQDRAAAPSPNTVPAAVPGTIVPRWRPDLPASVLAPDYQQIIACLEQAAKEGSGPLNCRQIAARSQWETNAAGVERVRAKAKRMADRGWLVKEPDGRLSAARPRGGGS